MIRAGTALVIFGKMHFLLISENEFNHEIKRDGRTSFIDSMKLDFFIRHEKLSANKPIDNSLLGQTFLSYAFLTVLAIAKLQNKN